MTGSVTKSPILPRVSIITPSYNQGPFLEQAIQSVLAQDYPNLEYIVIDGGSTDDSIEIINRYSSQMAYWVSRKDNGQADAINEGFRKATGKYVAWLNSDDVYLPGCIQKAVEVLEANPQAGMVFGQVEVINPSGISIGLFRPVIYRFEDLLTYKIIIPQQAAFFRRSILDKIGDLDTNLHFALDHEFFLRIGGHYPVIKMSDVMAQYRLSDINKGSTSRSKWAKEFVQILDLFFRQPAARQKYDLLQQKAYAGAYYRGACNLLDDGLYAQARRWYQTSVQYQLKFLLNPHWWVGFIRTFFGKSGNALYLHLKVWLAQRGLLDIRYDWWTALSVAEAGQKIRS